MKSRISATKIDGDGEVLSIPTPQNGEISLYFHIPFCTKKCPYCHFFVLPNDSSLHEKLFLGLQKHLSSVASLLAGRPITSVYFGGGTPSLFPTKYLEALLAWISPPPSCEVTLEANPENLSMPLLQDLKTIGFNRLSIGAQSFDDALLKHLGRNHNSQKTESIIEQSFSLGFNNISIDLMYDLPFQSLTQWDATLKKAALLPITHVSLYNLTIEPHTLFFKKKKELATHLPSPDISLRMYEMVEESLAPHFLPYEISAFAKEGFYSKHNTGYWLARPFLGFGPSAFSFFQNQRFQNIAHLEKYLKLLHAGDDPAPFKDILPEEDRKKELLAVQLRLRQGVHLPTFEIRHGPLSKTTWEAIASLREKQWVTYVSDTLSLTAQGRLFYDSSAAALI